MANIKFDANILKFMNLFETLTKVNIKDCFESDNQTYFVVQPGEMGKALGKGASNIRRISNLLNRKIKIVEFNPKLITFIKNLLYPVKVASASEEEGVVILEPLNAKTRGLLIGRGGQNLRSLEEKVRRYFPIKEIKVL